MTAAVTSAVTWAAPGRLNLIGDHTDYNDGFVLPMALPFRTTAMVRPREDGMLVIRSAQRDDETVQVPLASLHPEAVTGWAAYAAGPFWVLAQAGHLSAASSACGFDVEVDGQVPEGSGLSSSAALECAVIAAAADLLRLDLSRPALALLAQRAENQFVGVPSGIMDEMAAMLCTEGEALLLDTRTLHTEPVPLDLAGHRLGLLVVDSHSPHALVGGEYAERRRTCEEAARLLGVRALRDVSVAELPRTLVDLPDPVQQRRVRHVVTENDRVLRTVRLLCAGRVTDVGPLLTASHASLRDDYEVTVPQLDVAVEASVAAGAHGARMTGGGFGGCALALVDAGAQPEQAVRAAVQAAYAERGFGPPTFFTARPSAGAHRVTR